MVINMHMHILMIRGSNFFKTYCSKHVFPATVLRTAPLNHFEEFNRLRTARSKRCVATQKPVT